MRGFVLSKCRWALHSSDGQSTSKVEEEELPQQDQFSANHQVPKDYKLCLILWITKDSSSLHLLDNYSTILTLDIVK